MVNTNKCILFLLITSVAISQVLSIKCWECNSYLDPKCGDPFDDDIPITDCSLALPLPYLPARNAVACRTIKQRVRNQMRYIRGCAYVVEDGEEGPDGKVCIEEEKNGNYLEHCTCKRDGCNA